MPVPSVASVALDEHQDSSVVAIVADGTRDQRTDDCATVEEVASASTPITQGWVPCRQARTSSPAAVSGSIPGD
jgi:hypothetical protein